MASDNKGETKISLKMMVDTKNKKVLFAEAGKDFVDFTLHIMSLPLGSVVKLLKNETLVGSISDLYKSVESLNSQYFLSDQNKDCVLNPKASVNVPLLSINDVPTSNRYYKCNRGCSYITDSRSTRCPGCSYEMTSDMKYTGRTGTVNAASASSQTGEGYVKGLVTYMVMDNLEVKSMSTITGIALLNKFHVKDVSSLEEIDVQIGLNEGLAILKASLETKDVLTTVFLRQKIKRTHSEI